MSTPDVSSHNGSKSLKKAELNALAKASYDYQKIRIRCTNRLGIKKIKVKKLGPGNYELSGETKKGCVNLLNKETSILLSETVINAVLMERQINKEIERLLNEFPLWTEFLVGIKGVGPVIAAIVISEFDPYKAPTPSSYWKFAGCCPAYVNGWVSAGKDKDGKVIWKETTDKIRADKKTKGYRCPYNAWLKRTMLGLLADSFLKQKAEYSKHYYRMHVPEKHPGAGTGRYDLSEEWKVKSAKARHFGARRVMIKEFIKDLWLASRELEGLPTRVTYREEYLGGNSHKKQVS